MRRRVVPFVLVAVAVGGAIGVHRSPAAPFRAIGAAATVDATYSCRVRPEHSIAVYAGVTLRPDNQPPQPGGLSVTTLSKTSTQNGATTTVAQIGLGATKDSLRVDRSSCRRVKQQIPLSSSGLPGPPRTATPTFFGYFTVTCATTGPVLVRLRVTMTDHTPSQALLSIRNDSKGNRPIAFYRWSPRKVSASLANGCS